VSAAVAVPGRQHCFTSAMSDANRYDQREEDRLGHVLREVVEGRGRPVSGSLASAGVGSRAFLAAVERTPGRTPGATGERPRFGAIVVAAVLGAVVAMALALWPAIGHHVPAPSPSVRPAATSR
jgi:hypothetical protein